MKKIALILLASFCCAFQCEEGLEGLCVDLDRPPVEEPVEEPLVYNPDEDPRCEADFFEEGDSSRWITCMDHAFSNCQKACLLYNVEEPLDSCRDLCCPTTALSEVQECINVEPFEVDSVRACIAPIEEQRCAPNCLTHCRECFDFCDEVYDSCTGEHEYERDWDWRG